MRPRPVWLCALLVPFACASPPKLGDGIDASDDDVETVETGAQDARGDAFGASDAARDVQSDVADASTDIDAPDDVVDAGADALDAAAEAEASPPGGDTCPIFGTTTCVNGFEFRVHIDASADYNCGAVTPHCPKGWTCWQLNSQSQVVQATCP